MERRMLVAGNWKMYTTAGEGAVLVQDLADELSSFDGDVEVVVGPPFTGLKTVSTVIELDHLEMGLAAQDCHWESEGAFTGAIAPRMLVDLRVDYVIVGHSERREYFGETNETVNKKVKAVYSAGMVPIMCVGETLATRDSLETDSFVRDQVLAGAAGLTPEQAEQLVVAYEPIWAIGTGRTPTPESANDVARMIRATIGAMYGPPVAMKVRVLYGGSVKPENARMFFAEPDVDGALVGGAALKADSFTDIVRAAQ
ncbi:MAG: triose-phosphate isomerase [Coriobacteriia bacterium]|nr:triose-phosphate isomerase [Coriobacteriia bacterium]MBN2823049.1 triose-phosphate isomerase [Coriobacteriia bacterium]